MTNTFDIVKLLYVMLGGFIGAIAFSVLSGLLFQYSQVWLLGSVTGILLSQIAIAAFFVIRERRR